MAFLAAPRRVRRPVFSFALSGRPLASLAHSLTPPLFIATCWAQNKTPISKVLGAMAPELEMAIFDNVPEAPKDSED